MRPRKLKPSNLFCYLKLNDVRHWILRTNLNKAEYLIIIEANKLSSFL